jgi:hypothetical protein
MMLRQLAHSGLRSTRLVCRHQSSFPDNSEAVVVGGGVIGAITAFHLTKKGVNERHHLAQCSHDERPPGQRPRDMFSCDLARFLMSAYMSDNDWLRKSTPNSHVRSYWVSLPNQQKFGGRNVRMSPTWEECLGKGAFYGVGGGGWEGTRFYLPQYERRILFFEGCLGEESEKGNTIVKEEQMPRRLRDLA